ncbi:MAG TPA: TIGR01459 family HAD-type hydrolase [Caulobacteraceae bacterium]|jgi:HAD superfamily hydrolase (TIGR01459 family)
MSAPTLINGLSDVADRYDAILCDVWGVVHNGRESWPEACEALTRFQETRGPVVLISNAPRPSKAVTAQLQQLGVPHAAWSRFVTSGDATRAALAERAPGPVWVIGPPRDEALFEGLDLQRSGPGEAAFICCTGLVNDDVETPEDYVERLRAPASRGLEMICANPDRVVQKGDSLIYCAGAVADVYAGLGGRVIMEGKPYAPIYELALREAGDPDRRKVLAIGDAIATDVKGASDQDIDCLWVAEGIHTAELANDRGDLDPAKAETLLSREGARARYLAPRLVW